MRPHRITAAVVTVLALLLAGCGAGSRTPAATATLVPCAFPPPAQSLDVRVLAYNSSAVDPFTNTMVRSCSRDGVTLRHEPIDFAGQTQKTIATLSGRYGTYDIVETYGLVVPQFASTGKLRPLDDLVARYREEYGLDRLSPEMLAALSYDGKLYGLPTMAQPFTLVYRRDVFDRLGLAPPRTFAELREVAARVQRDGGIRYPLALPLLASADIATAYDAALGSLGTDYVDRDTGRPNFDTPQAAQAFTELRSLLPFMDPQVTTFAQPAVQQQMYNGSAAIAIMYSGRMFDLVQERNSRFSREFAFAPPPSVAGGDVLYNSLSVDGWAIPANTEVDPDLLFRFLAASVGPESARAAVPAAFPSRLGSVTPASSPFAPAQLEALGKAPPPEPFPWTSRISVATRPVVADVLAGRIPVEQGQQRMQDIATAIVAEYREVG
ncbi:ABC transporter substrate-binding protein [Pseudonocardia alni]|uniref:ABC transporter substrate-binding protein n=1 Tax=Pseudonocardia alni TaxID=33907 RepID=UPI001AD74055|nr:extracellular solute-binding protein [Pseudonocardia alni]MBO4237239.1 extracellular solute-binding protein [Pseudonocardia alni]